MVGRYVTFAVCSVLIIVWSAAWGYSNAAPESHKLKGRYAIVVSKSTYEKEEWRQVVDALRHKHNGEVFQYEKDVMEVQAPLAKFSPWYVCFVVRPEEMVKPANEPFRPNPFVEKVYHLTRCLDDDPYGDAIWGILTGYEPEDALRIARHKTPLMVKRGLGAFCAWLDRIKEGICFSEITDGKYMVKDATTGWKVMEKSDGPVDVTALFVGEINKNNVDVVWTSSHATERDFSGFRHNRPTGRIVPRNGRLVAIDLKGQQYEITTTNPKVYMPAGNCLIGNISGRECMALAWMRSGAYQMYGYTVPTGYGYMGWRTADFFMCHGGKFTLAEAFYATNQCLLFNLEKKLVTEPRDRYGHEVNDKNTVAFYGDPAWEVRVDVPKDAPKPIWEVEFERRSVGEKVEFEAVVRFNEDVDFSGGHRYYPVFAFLPSRVGGVEVVDSGDADAFEITDNFLIVRYKGLVKKGTVKRLVFKAKIKEAYQSGAKFSSVEAKPVSKFDERIVINITGCFANHDLFDALRKAEELGFQSVAVMPAGNPKHSLGKLPTLNFYEADETQRIRIKTSMSKFKHISIHQLWDNEWQKWIDCAEFLRAEIVTIHAGLRKKDETMGQFLNRRVNFFRQVGDYAKSKGVKIGVENEGGSYRDYVELIKAINHPAVGATIDVGHCAYFDEVKSINDVNERAKKLNEVICQLVRELGRKVYHFHLHDVKRYEDVDFSKIPKPYWKPGMLVDHRCVGEGIIDFHRLFAVLKEIGYDGLFELELEEPEMEEKALRSGEFLSRLM